MVGTIIIEPIDDKFVKLRSDSGMLRDVRSGVEYQEVVCSFRNIKYFEEVV